MKFIKEGGRSEMSTAAYRNRLLTSLLLSHSVPMQEMIADFGAREYVMEAIDMIRRDYRGKVELGVTGEVEDISMRMLDEAALYEQLQHDKSYDFNDMRCRIAYLLDELITKDTYLNIDDLAEVMMVSRSTVNNDLKKAKELLQKYNARIRGIPNKGIRFLGDEFSRRLVLIYEVFDYFPMGATMDKRVVEIIQDLSLKYGLSFSNKILLFKTVMISIYRIGQEQSIGKELPMYKNFEQDSEELRWFKEELEKIYAVSLAEEEIDFLSFPINTRNSAYTDEMDNEENEKLLRVIVREMIDMVETRYRIHIDEEDFYRKVRLHLMFLVNRLLFRIPVRDIFSDQIKIRFPLAFELAKTSMKVLMEKHSLMGSKVDTSYLAVYYALILDERKVLREEHERRRIAVITNRGRGTFELIRRQLMEILGDQARIDMLTVGEMLHKDLTGYQILFSTENIKTESGLPVILIEGILDQDSLSRKISELGARRLGPLEELSQLTDISVKVLHEKLTYEENVALITNDLMKNHRASEDVYERFLKKEKTSSMIYENGVAFPHLTDPEAKKISLTLGVVNPTSDRLKIIFFLLIPEIMSGKEEDTLMKIYDQIFRIITDKALVASLQEIESAMDLTEIRMKGDKVWN
ncbi:MAG: PRD domain-containing protein [Clostridia bacterium]|nr:PRD domain-containing protein [Clostridia bacterium]